MVRLLPVWAISIVMSAVYSQMTTMFVLQGNTLDPRMGPSFKITAASLSIFDTIAVIVWALAYDRFIVPAVRSVTGHPRGLTQLQRMGIGLVISIFSMVAATHSMLDSKDYLPISIFWQVPRYFIIGAAEVFTFVGQIEFFYDQSPDAIRSMGSALSACHHQCAGQLPQHAARRHRHGLLHQVQRPGLDPRSPQQGPPRLLLLGARSAQRSQLCRLPLDSKVVQVQGNSANAPVVDNVVGNN
jgi:hypothetical protein